MIRRLSDGYLIFRRPRPRGLTVYKVPFWEICAVFEKHFRRSSLNINTAIKYRLKYTICTFCISVRLCMSLSWL